MFTFKVKAWGQADYAGPGKSQIVGYRAPGRGVLVVQEGTGWVARQDGSRENIGAKSVVMWETGDWVEYGSDGGFKTCDYWAATEPLEEWEARVAEIFGPEDSSGPG